MNLAHMLAIAARSHPDRPAISIGTRVVMDYAGLARSAAGNAASLKNRGLVPGDRVMLAMKNNDRYFSHLFGCWWGGFTAAPVNAALHPRELAAIADDLDPKLIVADEAVAEGLTSLLPDIPILVRDSNEARRAERADPAPLVERALGDIAWIFYTSGTTGTPKGACLTHANLLAMTVAYLADVDQLSPVDSLLHLAATSHA